MLQAGRDGDVRAAEADGGELKGAPVEVGVELVGDVDALGGAVAVGAFSKLIW